MNLRITSSGSWSIHICDPNANLLCTAFFSVSCGSVFLNSPFFSFLVFFSTFWNIRQGYFHSTITNLDTVVFERFDKYLKENTLDLLNHFNNVILTSNCFSVTSITSASEKHLTNFGLHFEIAWNEKNSRKKVHKKKGEEPINEWMRKLSNIILPK